MLGGETNPWEFVPAACAIISFWHCCWLVLVFMRRLQRKSRSGLLMRQLWYIAVSDMVSAVFSIATFLLDQVPYQTTQSVCTASQYTIWAGFLLSTCMSILVQAHFTAGLLMSLRRWTRGLACLSQVLPALLLPATLIAGLDLWVTAELFQFDTASGCEWITKKQGLDISGPFTACAALAVILVNGLVYGLLLLEELSCGSYCVPSVVIPGSVGARVLRQAHRYLLVTLCTWLPYWLVALAGGAPTLTWAHSSWQAVSSAGVTLNGAMNVWSFALHNRHIRRALSSEAESAELETASTGSTESRHVGFDPTLHICELSQRTVESPVVSSIASSRSGIGSQNTTALLNDNGEDPLGFLFVVDSSPGRPLVGQ